MTDTCTTVLPAPVNDVDLSRPYFVGISGKGMAALARLCAERGYAVSGSDSNATPVLQSLGEAGCRVFLGHDGHRVAGASCVVVSTAIPVDNVEVRAARERGIAVVHRSDVLAALMREQVGVAVAGTHGKSTTTAMLTHTLAGAGLDPSYVIGAELADGRPGGHCGSGSLFVAEADESDRSFTRYSPAVGVILNMDHDHPETFANLGEVWDAYAAFARRVVPGGTLVLPADDPGAGALLRVLRDVEGLQLVTFGRSETASVRVRGLRTVPAGSQMTLDLPDEEQVDVLVPLLGEHNAMNAAAALTAGIAAGADVHDMVAALVSFGGVQRRLQRIGWANGVTVLDSFAHHPTAIRADLAAARELAGGRVLALFEPSGWQRVRLLGAEMGRALADADRVGLLGIHDGVGKPIPGLTAEAVSATVPARLLVDGTGGDGLFAALADLARPGDVIVCMGIGTVADAGLQVLAHLQTAPVGARC